MAVGTGNRERSDAEGTPLVKLEPGTSPGMARLSAYLLEQAIRSNPKAVSKMRGSLAMKIEGLDSGETIRFDRGSVTVAGVVDRDASIVVEAPLLTLGALNQTGRILRGIVHGEVKVKGALRHPLLLLRTRRLMQQREKQE